MNSDFTPGQEYELLIRTDLYVYSSWKFKAPISLLGLFINHESSGTLMDNSRSYVGQGLIKYPVDSHEHVLVLWRKSLIVTTNVTMAWNTLKISVAYPMHDSNLAAIVKRGSRLDTQNRCYGTWGWDLQVDKSASKKYLMYLTTQP